MKRRLGVCKTEIHRKAFAFFVNHNGTAVGDKAHVLNDCRMKFKAVGGLNVSCVKSVSTYGLSHKNTVTLSTGAGNRIGILHNRLNLASN